MAPADRFSRRISKLLLSYDKGEATSWTMSHGDKVTRLERVVRSAARKAAKKTRRDARSAPSSRDEWREV